MCGIKHSIILQKTSHCVFLDTCSSSFQIPRYVFLECQMLKILAVFLTWVNSCRFYLLNVLMWPGAKCFFFKFMKFFFNADMIGNAPLLMSYWLPPSLYRGMFFYSLHSHYTSHDMWQTYILISNLEDFFVVLHKR